MTLKTFGYLEFSFKILSISVSGSKWGGLLLKLGPRFLVKYIKLVIWVNKDKMKRWINFNFLNSKTVLSAVNT